MYQEGRFSQGGSDKEAFLEAASRKCSRLHFPEHDSSAQPLSFCAMGTWHISSQWSRLLLPTWNLGRPVTALTNRMMEMQRFLLPALNQALPPLPVVSVFWWKGPPRHLSYQMCEHGLLAEFLFYPFNVHSISSQGSTFLSEIHHPWLHSIFLSQSG